MSLSKTFDSIQLDPVSVGGGQKDSAGEGGTEGKERQKPIRTI